MINERITRILSLASSVILSTFISVSAQSWVQCSSLPESIVPYAVTVKGKIYAIRGNDFYSGTMKEPSSIHEYDPATNTWTVKAKMSTIRSLFGMIELDGKIYVIGGIDNANYSNCVSMADVEVFDPATGVWQTKSSMPKPLYVMGLVKAHGKIYVVGGVSKKIINGTKTDTTSNQLLEYDPAADVWTTKASMSRRRAWFDAVAFDNNIFAIGGNTGIPGSGENTIEEYDITSNKWAIKTTFINCFDGQCQSVVIKDKIYTLSSDLISNGTFTKAIIGEYDPAAGQWIEKTNMINPTMDFGKVVYNDQIYIVGGHLVSGMTYTNKVFKYDPVTNNQTHLPNISQWINGTVVLDGIIYAIGGVNSNGQRYNRVVKYDTRNDPSTSIGYEILPSKFILAQNYPNPFNPETTISYYLPRSEYVTLKVYNMLGREIGTLVNEYQKAGSYSSSFNALNSSLTTGVYFYKLTAGTYTQTKKMLLLK